MELSGYIAGLLEEHDYVILPGAGAFTTAYRPALPDGSGALLMPPSREITFQPNLRMDDGLLSGYLMRHTGIPLQEARKRISGYAEDLLYHLDREGWVTLDSLGTLRRQEGVITFQPLPSLERLPAAYGLLPVSLQAEETAAEAASAAGDEISRVTVTMPGSETDPAAGPAAPTGNGATERAHDQETPPHAGRADDAVTAGDGETFTGAPAGIGQAESPARISDRQLRQTLATGRIARIAIPAAALVVVALLLRFLVFPGPSDGKDSLKEDPSRKDYRVQEPATAHASPPGISSDTHNDRADTTGSLNMPPQGATGNKLPGISTDGTATAAVRETASAGDPVNANTGSLGNATAVYPWYAVAGSFRSQQNAGDFMAKLTREGYTPVSLGQIGSYFFIATGGFQTEREAVRAVNRYNDLHPGSEAWVYRSRR